MAAPVLVGLVFLWLGHPLRAAILLALAGVVLLLVLLGLPVDRWIARVASWVADAVGAVAGVGVGLLLVVVGAVLRVLRRDPLTPRSARDAGWQPATPARVSNRLATVAFGVEQPTGVVDVGSGGVRSVVRPLVLALGSIAAIMLVDVTVGMVWERLSRGEAPLAHVADAINLTGRTDTLEDPRAFLPAMADSPWAEEYFRELQLTPASYWPFTETRPRDFDGKYIHIEDWARRSYVAPDTPDDAPVVWMFGGSTTFGEGQRDEHTIASYVARAAERDGMPIVIKNYGQRGWTHFQEMILFEQLLAEGPAPDVALFYDGANEINAQSLGAKGVPTHTLVDQYAEKLTGGIVAEFNEPPPPPPSALSVAWEAYRGQSAIFKLGREVGELFGRPAGAFEAAATQDDPDGDGKVTGQYYRKTIGDGRRALEVYERGRTMTQFLAREYGVAPLFFWQPVMAGEVEDWVHERIPPPTFDITDALDDHEDVYIDGGHHNEEGARIVAERIWEELRPTLEAAAGGGASRAPRRAATTTTTAPAPTDLERIEASRAAFQAADGDPCAIRAWASQIADLVAGTPTEVERAALLVQDFLATLTETAPDALAPDVAIVQPVAAELPSIASASSIDPSLPFVSQLPIATDPSSGFVPAVQRLITQGAALLGCPE